jgi:hypothetical protein
MVFNLNRVDIMWEICEKDSHVLIAAPSVRDNQRGVNTTMNKKFNYPLLKSLFCAALIAVTLPAGAVESKDPIKLTIHDWTGQYLTTHRPWTNR